ncbi:MAG: FkbM family methyltransferase [Roseomonas sp.]|nr:FkbM family methyltransferase [Roseomonas sp.]
MRWPIRLEAFSVLARIIRHATYAEDAPPTQASLWSIHHDLQGALRSGHPEWIHKDRLHVRFADREAMAVVDLTNTQFIGADRSLASFRHGYEPEIGILIDAFVPDDGVLADVGANWGYFPLFLAARPGFRGRVLAVEPFPASAAALVGVISATGIGHLVEPVAVALGAAPGTATMSEELFTGNNRISGEGALAVPVDTLDRLADAQGLARLDLLKIDVEGTEAEVIQGASRMIARHRPIVVFENWLDEDGRVDVAPFHALEAIAPHSFYAIDLDPPTSTPAEPGAATDVSAPVTGRVLPITVDSRAALPPRINVVACRPDLDLAECINLGAASRQEPHLVADQPAPPHVGAGQIGRGLRDRLAAVARTVRRYASRARPAGGGIGPWKYDGHPDQPFGAVTYAQFGEDLLVMNLFSVLGINRPSYLDVGAHHPVNCSNTALLYSRGSRGVCIEANPNLVPAFAEMRPADLTLNIGCSAQAGTLDFYMIDHASGRNTFDRGTAEAFVAAHRQFSIREVRQIPVLPLDEIVARHCGGRWPDFLSLDVEGLDFVVLEASRLTSAEGPKVICVKAVAGNDTDSTSAIQRLLAARGFVLAARTIGNVIFARRDAVAPWTKGV